MDIYSDQVFEVYEKNYDNNHLKSIVSNRNRNGNRTKGDHDGDSISAL